MNEHSSDDTLTRLADAHWQAICRQSPMTALLAGEEPADDVLFRESEAAHDELAASAGKLHAAAAKIDAGRLAPDDQLTHALLLRETQELVEAHTLGAHLRPSLFPAGPDFNLVFLANSTALATPADAERYLARLATVPALFDELLASLTAGNARGFRYPAPVVLRAAEAAAANLAERAEDTPFYNPFRRSPLDTPAMARHAERGKQLIENSLLPALARYVERLRNDQGRIARDSIGCSADVEGEAFYAHLARRFTTSDLGTEEIHALGLAEVARLKEEIAAVAADAGFAGDVRGYRAFLAQDPAQRASTAEAQLTRMRALCKAIDGKLPGWFQRLPRISYGVELIPPGLADGLPPAYAQPGPADRTAAGTFWLSSRLDKCPLYLFPSLALHEAWPGHLMHIALMQEQAGLPAFRRHGAVKYTACIEGWAMYCEQLGVEMNLYETPHEHFGRLNMEQWRAARLVVDTGLHSRGWSREDAVAYLDAHVALTPEMIDAEVDRYLALPGQALGYQLGNLAFRRLRQRAEKVLGDNLNLRGFHDALLAAGPLTLPLLESLGDRWISAQRNLLSNAAGTGP